MNTLGRRILSMVMAIMVCLSSGIMPVLADGTTPTGNTAATTQNVTSWQFTSDDLKNLTLSGSEYTYSTPGTGKSATDVAALLPDTVTMVFSASSSANLPVTWTSADYVQQNGNWPTAGSYHFTAALPSGYALADGVSPITLTVKLTEVATNTSLPPKVVHVSTYEEMQAALGTIEGDTTIILDSDFKAGINQRTAVTGDRFKMFVIGKTSVKQGANLTVDMNNHAIDLEDPDFAFNVSVFSYDTSNPNSLGTFTFTSTGSTTSSPAPFIGGTSTPYVVNEGAAIKCSVMEYRDIHYQMKSTHANNLYGDDFVTRVINCDLDQMKCPGGSMEIIDSRIPYGISEVSKNITITNSTLGDAVTFNSKSTTPSTVNVTNSTITSGQDRVFSSSNDAKVVNFYIHGNCNFEITGTTNANSKVAFYCSNIGTFYVDNAGKVTLSGGIDSAGRKWGIFYTAPQVAVIGANVSSPYQDGTRNMLTICSFDKNGNSVKITHNMGYNIICAEKDRASVSAITATGVSFKGRVTLGNDVILTNCIFGEDVIVNGGTYTNAVIDFTNNLSAPTSITGGTFVNGFTIQQGNDGRTHTMSDLIGSGLYLYNADYSSVVDANVTTLTQTVHVSGRRQVLVTSNTGVETSYSTVQAALDAAAALPSATVKLLEADGSAFTGTYTLTGGNVTLDMNGFTMGREVIGQNVTSTGSLNVTGAANLTITDTSPAKTGFVQTVAGDTTGKITMQVGSLSARNNNKEGTLRIEKDDTRYIHAAGTLELTCDINNAGAVVAGSATISHALTWTEYSARIDNLTIASGANITIPAAYTLCSNNVTMTGGTVNSSNGVAFVADNISITGGTVNINGTGGVCYSGESGYFPDDYVWTPDNPSQSLTVGGTAVIHCNTGFLMHCAYSSRVMQYARKLTITGGTIDANSSSNLIEYKYCGNFSGTRRVYEKAVEISAGSITQNGAGGIMALDTGAEGYWCIMKAVITGGTISSKGTAPMLNLGVGGELTMSSGTLSSDTASSKITASSGTGTTIIGDAKLLGASSCVNLTGNGYNRVTVGGTAELVSNGHDVICTKDGNTRIFGEAKLTQQGTGNVIKTLNSGTLLIENTPTLSTLTAAGTIIYTSLDKGFSLTIDGGIFKPASGSVTLHGLDYVDSSRFIIKNGTFYDAKIISGYDPKISGFAECRRGRIEGGHFIGSLGCKGQYWKVVGGEFTSTTGPFVLDYIDYDDTTSGATGLALRFFGGHFPNGVAVTPLARVMLDPSASFVDAAGNKVTTTYDAASGKETACGDVYVKADPIFSLTVGSVTTQFSDVSLAYQAAAESGGTLMLLQDITTDYSFNFQKPVVLDLNNHKLNMQTSESASNIMGGSGDMVVKNGTISASGSMPALESDPDSHNMHIINNTLLDYAGSGSLTVENVTLFTYAYGDTTKYFQAPVSRGASGILLRASNATGPVKLKSCTLEATSTLVGSLHGGGRWDLPEYYFQPLAVHSVELSGGSNVTLDDCTANAYNYGTTFYHSGSGLLTVNNITYNGRSSDLVQDTSSTCTGKTVFNGGLVNTNYLEYLPKIWHEGDFNYDYRGCIRTSSNGSSFDGVALELNNVKFSTTANSMGNSALVENLGTAQVKLNNCSGDLTGHPLAVQSSAGSTVISGGTYQGTTLNASGDLARGDNNRGDNNHGYVCANGGTLTVSGANFSAAGGALIFQTGGVLNVKDSTFTGVDAASSAMKATGGSATLENTTLSGASAASTTLGTINSENSTVSITGGDVLNTAGGNTGWAGAKGNILFRSGSFSAQKFYVAATEAVNTHIKLLGGTFASLNIADTNSAYKLPSLLNGISGFIDAQGNNLTGSLSNETVYAFPLTVKSAPIATIGNNKYLTISDAFNAAKIMSGDVTITLMGDLQINESLLPIKGTARSITLDINGYTITNVGNISAVSLIDDKAYNLTLKNGTIDETASDQPVIKLSQPYDSGTKLNYDVTLDGVTVRTKSASAVDQYLYPDNAAMENLTIRNSSIYTDTGSALLYHNDTNTNHVPRIENSLLVTNSGHTIYQTYGPTRKYVSPILTDSMLIGNSKFATENAYAANYSAGVHGSYTLKQDAGIPAEISFGIGSGDSLTLQKGITLTNNGTINNYGAFLYNLPADAAPSYGILQNNGTLAMPAGSMDFAIANDKGDAVTTVTVGSKVKITATLDISNYGGNFKLAGGSPIATLYKWYEAASGSVWSTAPITISPDGRTATAVFDADTAGMAVTSGFHFYVEMGPLQGVMATIMKTGAQGIISITNKTPMDVTVTQADWVYGDVPPNYTYTASYKNSEGTVIPVIIAPGDSGKIIETYYKTGGKYTSTTAPTQAGDYEINLIVENSTYAGNGSARFTIQRRAITPVIAITSAPAYTGNSCHPAITVSDNGNNLTEGTDYVVTYGPNIDAGTNAGSVKVDLIGNYSGSAAANFDIQPQAVTATIAPLSSTEYTGLEIKPQLVVSNEKGEVFSPDLYDVTYSNNINAGTAAATVNFKGNYSGTASTNFTITKKPLADSMLTLSGSLTYTGVAQTPTYSLSGAAGTVASGEYTAALTNNVNAGTGTLRITAAPSGNYTGEIVRDFTIAKKALAPEMIKITGSYTYTGSEQTPSYTVEDTVAGAIKSGDYTVTLANNRNAGTASVTITVATNGNYSGSASKNFTIAPIAITPALSAEKVYDGTNNAAAVLTVSMGAAQGVLPGDSLSFSGIQASFDGANVGDHTVSFGYSAVIGTGASKSPIRMGYIP